MKQLILISLMINLVMISPISALASDNWPIKNGTPQLTNYKGTTLSNELFL